MSLLRPIPGLKLQTLKSEMIDQFQEKGKKAVPHQFLRVATLN